MLVDELGEAPSDQLPAVLKLPSEPLKTLTGTLIVMVSFTWALVPFEFVTVSPIFEVVPTSVGIPLIVPVPASKFSPVGRLPVKAYEVIG